MIVAVPRRGRGKATRLLTQCRISQSKTVGGLSDRQRGELLDLFPGLLHPGTPAYSKTVLLSPLTDLVIMVAMFAIFLFLGTALFVRQETNR